MADNLTATEELKQLLRNDFLVFIDPTQDFTFENNDWTRVKKSTESTYTANEQTEENDFIDSADTETDVIGNALAIKLNQRNIQNDPVYEFLQTQMIELPTGEDCKVPALYCFPNGQAVRGIAPIMDKELSPTDKSIDYSLTGVTNRTIGTWEINESTQEVEFTPSTALKATPSSISIVKGEDGTVVISGGTGTYTVSTETANIEATLGLDGKTVTIETSLSSANSDTLTISDGVDEIEVAITCTTPETQGEG